MRLHKDTEGFRDIIEVVSQETKIHEEQIEKDYYVSLLLKEIKKNATDIVFKGGTSLSKCYKLIKRFSEDIDLNVKKTDDGKSKPPQSRLKQLKEQITTSIENVELTWVNNEKGQVRSRGVHNKYLVKYTNLIDHTGTMKETIEVETSLMYHSFPCEKLMVSNYITEFLRNSEENAHLIDTYDLQEFEIDVQSIERTFIDKVFAIMDYVEANNFDRTSRHLYDLHMIWNDRKDGFCSDPVAFKELFDEVSLVRAEQKEYCISAQNGYPIMDTLSKIVHHHPYKDDYNGNTLGLLYTSSAVPYESTIETLNEIMESGLLPEVIVLTTANV